MEGLDALRSFVDKHREEAPSLDDEGSLLGPHGAPQAVLTRLWFNQPRKLTAGLEKSTADARQGEAAPVPAGTKSSRVSM